jgi:16S rRNA processing protein RimM
VVALVRGVHGLRGDVRIEILTDLPELRYAPGAVLHREGSAEPLTVAWSSPIADGPGWRIRFEEVPSRGEAETLKGVYLEAVVGPEAEPARGSYFWHEIIGTPVTGTDGAALGTVREVYRSGGAEVFVVAGGEYGEFDVPAVRDFVRVLAPRRGEIVIDAEALDLQPPRRRGEGEPRPKAPRRRTRRPQKAPPAEGASEAAVTELGPDATASSAAPAETPDGRASSAASAETPDATAGVATADPSMPGAASGES